MNTSGASQKWTAVPGTELNDHLDIGTKATHEIKHDNFDLGREAPNHRPFGISASLPSTRQLLRYSMLSKSTLFARLRWGSLPCEHYPNLKPPPRASFVRHGLRNSQIAAHRGPASTAQPTALRSFPCAPSPPTHAQRVPPSLLPSLRYRRRVRVRDLKYTAAGPSFGVRRATTCPAWRRRRKSCNCPRPRHRVLQPPS